MAFLTTRVSLPDLDDYKKLCRVIKYLRMFQTHASHPGSRQFARGEMVVDPSFAIHKDMKSHTGAIMSLGKGLAYSTSVRQRLNSKSSTKAKLVGVDDPLGMILWTRSFLHAQGYQVDDNLVFQDNQSAMLLEKNGRSSSGKRTRHINIRYFFAADRVKAGELNIAYILMDEMDGVLHQAPAGLQVQEVLTAYHEPSYIGWLTTPTVTHRSVLEM